MLNLLHKQPGRYTWLMPLFMHLTFAALFIMAYVQYLERTIPFDGGFYSFKIIFYETFNVENARWGACYNQVLPLLAVKAGCTLPVVLKCYSVSFVLCSYIFFLIIYYGFKQKYAAMAFVLFNMIAYRHNFYYQVSEIHALAGPMFLFFALLQSQWLTGRRKTGAAFLLFVLIFWMMNIHVLGILIIAFMVAYTLIDRPQLRREIPFMAGIALGFGYFIYLYLSIPANSYQGSKLVSMADVQSVFIKRKDNWGYRHFMWVLEQKHYMVMLLLAAFTGIYLLVKKRFLKFALYAVSGMGMGLLMLAANTRQDSPIVYENYYALPAYFIGLYFVLEVMRHTRHWWPSLVFGIVILVSFIEIMSCNIFFKEHIAYLNRTVNNLRGFTERKFVLDRGNIDWSKVWVEWDFPFQSLLLSSLSSPDSALTFYVTDDFTKNTPRIYEDTTVFVGPPWQPYWINSTALPVKYFNLKNTVYRRMGTLQDAGFNDSLLNESNLILHVPQKAYSLYKKDNRNIPVTVTNKSGMVIPSSLAGGKGVQLAYRVYGQKTNKMIAGGNSSFEVDIYPGHSINTGLVVKTGMLGRGTYKIEAGIVRGNGRMTGPVQSFTLSIK